MTASVPPMHTPHSPHGVIPFCIPGRHPVTDSDSWSLIRASLNPARTGWVRDDESHAQIVCCDEHQQLVPAKEE